MMKKISAVMMAVMFCAAWAPVVLAQTKTHHVIFVVTSADPEDWNTAMVLTEHFLEGIKPEKAEVEVLAYGVGISIMAKGAVIAPQMAELEKMGVHFVACENAMRAHKILKADLLPGVTTVSSGVVELVKKQEAGWAYVKVGK